MQVSAIGLLNASGRVSAVNPVKPVDNRVVAEELPSSGPIKAVSGERKERQSRKMSPAGSAAARSSRRVLSALLSLQQSD